MASDTKYTAALKRTKSFRTTGSQTITGTIEQWIIETTPEALIDTLRVVSAVELQEQVRLDNPPSSVIVDGRDSRVSEIAQAERRVRMIFADTKLLLKAAKEAFDLLVHVTRVQSPAKNSVVARDNYLLKHNNSVMGLLPGAFSTLQPSMLTSRSVIRIVGPVVKYGRRIYWNPVGASKSSFLKAKQTSAGPRMVYANQYAPRWKPYSSKYVRRLVREAYGPGKQAAEALGRVQSQRPKPGRSEGTTQIVKRLMRAKQEYKQLGISDAWISYAPAGRWGKRSRDDRVPTISIRIKRGKGNLASRLGG